MAATGGILWVGTESGRLIRHDTVNHSTEEVRGRLGVGRLDSAVWRIFADPHSRAALIILRNADGYLAHGTGLVRPRWLAKLRGLRCVSATWLRLPAQHGMRDRDRDRSIVLLGTAFGALFSLAVDSKHQKEDSLYSLWNAPSGERVDGVRVEQVAGKFVATVATSAALYLFSDALTLADLFSDDRVTRIDPSANAAVSSALNISSNNLVDDESPLPSELHFMTGSSGVASRRFVWAAASGVTHGQVAVRRRRVDKSSDSSSKSQSHARSTVIADVVDRDTIAWDALKEKSGVIAPLSCNLTAFHVLVLYPSCVLAFNYISGLLTQNVDVWNSDQGEGAGLHLLDETLKKKSSSRAAITSPTNSKADGATIALRIDENRKFLSTPAAGFARDVLVDAIWIYSADGEFARLSATNEEQTEAWKTAKAMGRFDLAMALAPLVSGGMRGDDSGAGGSVDGVMNSAASIFQTREAVLEAQADHAAKKGDWDAAAQLYAKTNQPIESVLLRIVDACWTRPHGVLAVSGRGETGKLRDLGIGSRLETLKHVITYLVRKLDRMDTIGRPMQRTIVATLLVQLYSSQLASETNAEEREEMRKDFANFLADRHADLDFRTAMSILSKNGCYEEAWNLAVLSGNILDACEMSSRKGLIEPPLSLLKNSVVLRDADVLSQLVTNLANGLAPQSPKRVAAAVGRALKKDGGHFLDHMTVLHGLARVIREVGDAELSREAYLASTGYLTDVLMERRSIGNNLLSEEDDTREGNVNDKGNGDGDDFGGHHDKDASKIAGVNLGEDKSNMGIDRDWFNLVTFLFVLHAEYGVEAEAQRSYDVLVAPLVQKSGTPSKLSPLLKDTVGVILRCSLMANFRTLCVYVYQALGLHELAIDIAVGIDLGLAEGRVSALGRDEVTPAIRQKLWCRIARASEDAVGVVERSKGVLHIEDVLNDMEPFESASERVKMAVANSLQEHKRRANAAKAEAASALEVTAFLRDDVNRVKKWHKDQRTNLSRRRPTTLTCGNDAFTVLPEIMDMAMTQSSSARNANDAPVVVDCPRCGVDAIESVDLPFTKGLTLPVKTSATIAIATASAQPNAGVTGAGGRVGPGAGVVAGNVDGQKMVARETTNGTVTSSSTPAPA